LLVGAISLFGVSYMILMPIVADEVLHMGIGGLGLLMSWAGAGALVAALILARVSYMRHRGRLLMVACGVFTVCLVAFSFSRSAAWSCGLIACVGWASVTAVSLVNTILQTLVPDALRGRAMSAYMFTFAGVLPLGNVLSGGLAHVVGVPHAIALSGSACAIVCAVIFARNKQIVQL
jgi:predicted MFS family arabinose efflux permease